MLSRSSSRMDQSRIRLRLSDSRSSRLDIIPPVLPSPVLDVQSSRWQPDDYEVVPAATPFLAPCDESVISNVEQRNATTRRKGVPVVSTILQDVCKRIGHENIGYYDDIARTANFTMAINAPDKFGNTAMHYLAVDKTNSSNGHYEALIFAEVLFRYGARVDIKNPRTKKTALECAIACKNHFFIYLFFQRPSEEFHVTARRIIVTETEQRFETVSRTFVNKIYPIFNRLSESEQQAYTDNFIKQGKSFAEVDAEELIQLICKH